MPGKAKTVAKKPAVKAAAPYKKEQVSHFEARPKNFGIGADVPYSRDISRFMRWPVFVTRQRKKRVLQRRLKIPRRCTSSRRSWTAAPATRSSSC